MHKQINISVKAKESDSSEFWQCPFTGGIPIKGTREIFINFDASEDSRQSLVEVLAKKIAYNAFVCALASLDDGTEFETIKQDESILIEELQKFYGQADK